MTFTAPAGLPVRSGVSTLYPMPCPEKDTASILRQARGKPFRRPQIKLNFLAASDAEDACLT